MLESKADSVRYGYNVGILHNDLLTYIYELIQPRVRELNALLLKEDELKALALAARLMLSFGISPNHKLNRGPEDTRTYDPNFEALLSFKVPPLQATRACLSTAASPRRSCTFCPRSSSNSVRN